ncbi:MAG TPA: NAD(P)H-binding protein [Micromonosporaceae bacterium]|nr:NAD(P)H-binding protein [Micromonosporaceae bacterium]
MTILVTGATGNIGRMVVDHLLAAGATGVRALTVDPARAALPEPVEVVRGYLRRPETLPAALDGVDRMYLAPTPDTVREVVAAARRAGVRRIVDLSGEPQSWWGTVATAVEEFGGGWTHLWPGDFMENTLTWAPQIRTAGEVGEPWPLAASTPVAMDDIAAVASAALLEDGHDGRAYSLTGPEVLTRADLVRLIARAAGRDIRFVQTTREDTVDRLSPAMGDTAAWYVDNVLAGMTPRPSPPSPTVERVTGRPATTFARWAAAHADSFR